MTDATPAGAPSHDELPLPDYDHLPVESLQHRLRTLDLAGLEQVRAYEAAHANRPLVLQTIAHRRDELRAGAEPSGGDPAAPAPEAAPAAAGRWAVSGATTGPVNNPPSQGVPTNPGQPRGSGTGSTQSRVQGD